MASVALMDDRLVDRDEVYHRARGADSGGQPLQMLIVNLSPHGMMARCEQSLGEDERITLTLPVAGKLGARVRWALGGRIGCHFDGPIPLANYYEPLTLLLKR